MRIAFSRHADSKGMLSNKALMAALKEVEAPVLTNGSSAESIFRRADANLSGAVDFDEFMRAAQLPDELEMVLEDNDLRNLTPAIRACIADASNQLACFAGVSEEALCAAVDASAESLKQQLIQVHRKVNRSVLAKAQLQEALEKDPGKFSIRKMATGTIDDFHKGLQDRIGG